MKASEDLRHEHVAVMMALNIIEKMVGNIHNNQEPNVSDIEDIIGFLKEFADKCHHGKEEIYYFPALEKVGIPHNGGPVGVMLSEHEQGRSYIRQMHESTANGKLDKNAFTMAATSYVNLMRNHIHKENNVLFPMGDAKLSEQDQRGLTAAFERHEEEVIGEGKHQSLHVLLERLQKSYGLQ